MARERADGHMVSVVADVRQVGQPADVDQHRRRRQPQLHQRQQRVAAGEQLGVVAVLGEQRDRVVGRVGPDVVEQRGNHFPALAAASTDCTMLW